MSILRLALAQINPLVGDIHGNTELVLDTARVAQREGVDMLVFPELTLTGYPPEDLLLRSSIVKRIDEALSALCKANLDIALVVGYPLMREQGLYNVAGVIYRGKVIAEYAKQALPNYQVFDEKRYFQAGTETLTFSFKGVTIGLSICEDIWDGGPIMRLRDHYPDLLVNLNASPFHQDKHNQRERLICQRAKELACPIVYVNQVGGQDELVFDGGSMASSMDGQIVHRSPLFTSSLDYLSLSVPDKSLTPDKTLIHYPDSPLPIIYQALVLGVQDYVNKNGFPGVVLGLSGGIDSALTLAIAVDALGPERVEAVMMPFVYTSQMSLEDAEQEAQALGVNYRVMGIEPIYNAYLATLSQAFDGRQQDKTEENIQARSRGVLLMSLSNKLGYLVLTTGNKSEMAVGYATLYGDMAGGLDVLKDVPKTLVFALSRYRNTLGEVIPERVITRPPSAELAPGQKDEDSLPAYDVLDQILERYIEADESAETIIAAGFDESTVKRVLRMVDMNEYKRRQAPIGIRISCRAFGRDRRYPITNGWRIGD